MRNDYYDSINNDPAGFFYDTVYNILLSGVSSVKNRFLKPKQKSLIQLKLNNTVIEPDILAAAEVHAVRQEEKNATAVVPATSTALVVKHNLIMPRACNTAPIFYIDRNVFLKMFLMLQGLQRRHVDPIQNLLIPAAGCPDVVAPAQTSSTIPLLLMPPPAPAVAATPAVVKKVDSEELEKAIAEEENAHNSLVRLASAEMKEGGDTSKHRQPFCALPAVAPTTTTTRSSKIALRKGTEEEHGGEAFGIAMVVLMIFAAGVIIATGGTAGIIVGSVLLAFLVLGVAGPMITNRCVEKNQAGFFTRNESASENRQCGATQISGFGPI